MRLLAVSDRWFDFLVGQKLFKDLVDSLFEKIQEENSKVSSDFCKALLKELHGDMSAQADKHLQIQPEDEDMYSFQSTEFKVRWILCGR